jgi:farnesyl diphosphate synthase
LNTESSTRQSDFAARLAALRTRINDVLEDRLSGMDGDPAQLCEAMRYSVLGEGKRLRPLLVYASGATARVDAASLDSIGAAIELVHAYSLVHDDLPAMDDDDLRRGRPTTHVAFDEATAILVGDALQARAFEILAADPCWENRSEISCKLIEYLAKASGTSGMAGGQAMDLAASGEWVSAEALDEMYARKTGRLIRAAVRMPLLCNPATTAETFAATDAFAAMIGLAFQVKDDLLEVEGTTELIGKPQGSDQRNAKATYPALMGLAASRRKLDELYGEAIAQLAPLGERAEELRALASYIVTRES